MMRLIKAFAVIGLLLGLASPAMAQSGCGGQFPAGTFCGNGGVTLGLPGPTAITPGVISMPAGTVLGNPTTATAPATATTAPLLIGATTTSPGYYAQITGDTFARVRVGLNSTDVASIAFGPGNAARNAFIEYVGAGSLRFGGPDAAAPVAQTLGVQNVVAGTSNTPGTNLTINGSRGTGTGIGGDIIFQTAPAGSSGSTQNVLAGALTISHLGYPMAATASPGTNTTQLATTAFVQAALASDCTTSGAFLVGTGSSSQCSTVAGSTAVLNGGPLTINSISSTNTQGLVISQTTPNTGSLAGPVTLNSITVIDQGQTVTGSATDSYGQITNQTSALRLNYTVAGGADNHFGLNVAANITATNGGTVPILSSCYVNVGTITGDCWANIAVGNVGPSGNLNQNMMGYSAELLVADTGVVLSRVGFEANSQGPTVAIGVDAAFMINTLNLGVTHYMTAAPWKTGLYLSSNYYGAGTFPIASTGNVILSDTGTVANFISAHTLTVTGNILDFPNVSLKGNGEFRALNIVDSGAFIVGANGGTTNATFTVDTSNGSGNGVYVFSTAAGSDAGITTVSSATNESLRINAKGSGIVKIGNVSTGGVALSTTIITSGSAGALEVGPNGATNPTFVVDDSAVSAANGVYIFSTAAGSGANITAISSATNEALKVNAKGSGTIDLAGTSTGGVTIHGSFTATGLVTNADLVNAATTVNGQTCTLGSSCTVTASATSITVGTTTLASGAANTILYQNGASPTGTVGEIATANSSVLVTSSGGVPSLSTTLPSGLTATNMALTTPSLGVATGTTLALNGCSISTFAFCDSGTNSLGGATLVTSNSSGALVVGPNGQTNPTLQVNSNPASAATGILITGAAAGGGVELAAISSATNEVLNIDAKGSANIVLGSVSTGAIVLTRATSISAPLTYAGVTFNNTVTGTGNLVGSANTTFTGTTTVATLAATTVNAFTLGGAITAAGNNATGFGLLSASTHAAPGALTFESNGTTLAGSIDTSQRWIIGPNAVGAQAANVLMTISRNAATAPQVGTFAPLLNLVQVDGASTDASLVIQGFGTGSNGGVRYAFARGTAASPTAIQSADNIGVNFAYGYQTTTNTYIAAAGFVFTATNNFTSTTTGGRIDLYATSVGSTGASLNASVGAGFMIGTTTDPGLGSAILTGHLSIGSSTAATLSTGEVAFAKISASGTAPGAGFGKMEWVAGTTGGTCKLIAYAGTSTTPTTIVDNVGSGC
jgi:hypothetical protein